MRTTHLQNNNRYGYGNLYCENSLPTKIKEVMNDNIDTKRDRPEYFIITSYAKNIAKKKKMQYDKRYDPCKYVKIWV